LADFPSLAGRPNRFLLLASDRHPTTLFGMSDYGTGAEGCPRPMSDLGRGLAA
jgi:hypothetical protein